MVEKVILNIQSYHIVNCDKDLIFQLNAGMLSSICTYNIFIVQGLGAEINEYTTHPTLTAIQNFNHGTVFQILVNM